MRVTYKMSDEYSCSLVFWPNKMFSFLFCLKRFRIWMPFDEKQLNTSGVSLQLVVIMVVFVGWTISTKVY